MLQLTMPMLVSDQRGAKVSKRRNHYLFSTGPTARNTENEEWKEQGCEHNNEGKHLHYWDCGNEPVLFKPEDS